MSEKRVQLNNIVKSQLPNYVRDEFPLIEEFLEQYYIAQEFQGAPVDLIQNIDKYIKIDETTNLTESAFIGVGIDEFDETITVSGSLSPQGTRGFPDSYGLLQIGDEIITYTGKTDFSFTGCIRGFSGVTSLKDDFNADQLVFKTSESSNHESGSEVKNLSILFLKEFLQKTKRQILPGIENKSFNEDLNEKLFLKNARDFYLAKGTDRGFEILFKALYNEDVKIVKPSELLSTPSNAQWRITNDLVVEPVFGDPEKLQGSTLFQDPYGSKINKAYGPITFVEKINVGAGQTYYKLVFDAGYNRDIRVSGSIYGDFQVQPKTKVIGRVSAGSSAIVVDSTVGFESDGELYLNYEDNTVGIISYRSKTLNQFLDCTNIDSNIPDSTSIGINTFAYGTAAFDDNELIEVRINSVLSDLEVTENAYLQGRGDTAKIKTFGVDDNSFKAKNWLYNVSPSYKVNTFDLLDSSDNTYNLNLNVNHYFYLGDGIELIYSNGQKKTATVIGIPSGKSITVRGQGQLSENLNYTVKKSIRRVTSNSFVNASIYTANIQNLYRSKKNKDNYLVASGSLPNYNSQPIVTTDRSITFSGTFIGDEITISQLDHGFYTGDSVYYTSNGNSSLFDDGLYFVERVNRNTVKFALSRSNLYNSKYINFENSVRILNNTITPFDLKNKTLTSQKILREINPPSETTLPSTTNPGFTGIFVNGVELLNYKSGDSINYGKIEKINITSPGYNYDVVNTPTLIVSDQVGTGATGYAAISGVLKEIRVIDPGFDYISAPTVKITGGNGEGAKASPTMRQTVHSVPFSSSLNVTTGATDSTIGFSTYHKFRIGEPVIYKTGSQKAISGISTGSIYYTSIVNSNTVKLHETRGDALAGINTITLSAVGEGNHNLESVNRKLLVDSISVIDSGSGYENKKRTVLPVGINTATNVITIKDHDYKSGEIVKYTSEGTEISGLNSGSEYYVTKVDDNNFKLSNINVGVSTVKELFYNEKEYVNLTSSGSGTQVFNYPDITVSLVGSVGISSIGEENFEAVIQPIFRGEVTSVHLTSNGVGYGSSEIINFERTPLVTLSTGTEAQLLPVVSGGRITEVIILNSGKNYTSIPDLTIEGEGIGGVLTPVIENGRFTSVKVIHGGINYTQETSIVINSSGQGAEFKPVLQKWTINLFERHFNNFTLDDGFLTNGNNDSYGLQYSHIYSPRKLREQLFSVDQGGNTLYGKTDLRKINSIESTSLDHSPIIGWAYDGNPIYGPYGYSKRSGGSVVSMKSGYQLSISEDRPPSSVFPEGLFIEDYEHKNVLSESTLDENNGRFCVTPEFPEGTYAYFATISNVSDTSGPFSKYRRPVFPYLIGDSFKNSPNISNFSGNANQDYIDLNNSEWSRVINPYNLIEEDSNYSYTFIPNNLSQTIDIESIAPGTINSIGINSGGTNYRVGDQVVFDNSNTQGSGASAVVSLVDGKEVNSVSVATSTIAGVEIYPDGKDQYLIVADNPHNLQKDDIINITGFNTTSSYLENSYSAGITSARLVIAGLNTTGYGVSAPSVTGIVTYFSVIGELAKVRENDVLNIQTEKVKVLNVDYKLSRIRVLREVQGTTGSAHTATTSLFEDPRKIRISAKKKLNNTSVRENRQLYFDPNESVALGTSFGVGIGTTISFSNPGTGLTEIFVPTKSIYYPNHNLATGDALTYNFSNGNGIVVAEEGNVGVGTTLSDGQNLFAVRVSESLIGISTVRVGLDTSGTFVGVTSTYRDSRSLYFVGVGTGVIHSFKTNYDVLTAEVNRNIVTVSTASTHGISPEHAVNITVNPRNTITYIVKYNDHHRKLIINPQSFVAGDVNVNENTITLESHGFVTGDKVIHTSSGASGGLTHNQVYYIVRVDNNNVKLATSRYNAVQVIPITVDITSASSGTINPINPALKVYKNSTIVFDLSDSSLSYVNFSTRYPAFDFNFYVNSNFAKVWDKPNDSKDFYVTKQGEVGVSDDAKATLIVDEKLPDVLFYKLVPVYESDIPERKENIVTDFESYNAAQIQVKNSVYSGRHSISIGSSTEFTYTLKEIPEKTSYSSTNSDLSYKTDCTHTTGPICQISITNKGKNYYSLPGISSVKSKTGTGALLEANSSDIGKVKRTKINDIGYDFPTDSTLSPSVNLPQVIKIASLASIESIGVSSVGKGYLTSPKLLVFDAETGRLVEDVDLQYDLGTTDIKILKNTYGISNLTPRILPVHNSNGVGISTISYNTSNKNATATLINEFSDTNDFPFKVNDKILVENVSVGVGSTARGYNSDKYGYNLFTVVSTDENIGGAGATVTFSLSDYYNDSVTTPGVFDSVNNSAARIIPEKHFPQFNITLTTNDFGVGEEVRCGSSIGIVESWDSGNGILRISSKEDFPQGEIVKGLSTKTQGIASKVYYSEGFLNLEAKSKVVRGWQVNSGFLNDDLQRIQDSDYYQNFSYALKSRVPYQTWNESVSSLNHTVGLKKFSDYQLESSSTNASSMVVGISTELTSFQIVSDLIGVADLNCVYDFDLVKESTFEIGDETLTTEILFANRTLTDFEESVGNRVLNVDDMSGLFNSNPRSTPYEVVSSFNIDRARAMKFLTLVKDRRYTTQRQLLIVDLVHDGAIAYTNQYGRLESVYDQGSFDFNIFGDAGQLLFYPTNFALNDYDVSTLAYRLDDDLIGYGTTNIGPTVIKNDTVSLASGITTTIVSIAKTYSSAKVLIELTPDTNNTNRYEFNQLNIVHDGTDVTFIEYAPLSTSLNEFAVAGLGTYNAYLEGSSLKVDFTPGFNVGVGSTGIINTVTIGLPDVTNTGSGSHTMKHAKFETTTTSISAAPYPTQHVIAEYQTDSFTGYDGAYCFIQAHNESDSSYQFSEFIVVDDYVEGIPDSETYDTEFGYIETSAGIGTIGSRILTNSVGIAATVQILFTPIPGTPVKVNTFLNAIRGQDDTQSSVTHHEGTIKTGIGLYEGTERDIKRSFEMFHRGNPIFERKFIGNDTNIVDTDNDVIIIPNHFFVTGEKIKYFHGDKGIGISNTSFPGVGVTNRLPEDLYVVKVDNNKIKVAATAEKALKSAPEFVNLTSVGIGTSHRFVMQNPNNKCIISLDNNIQSPIVATSVTTRSTEGVFTTDDLIKFDSTKDFLGGDLIKMNNEIMAIEAVGVGSTNMIRVRRARLGTFVAGYSTGTQITKVRGNFNIIDNTLNFAEPPFGNTPLGTTTNPPDEVDWLGIATGSSFHGRVFLRSGTPNTSADPYSKNYIFDDISQDFDTQTNEFVLKSEGQNVSGISADNAVFLINDIFQGPGETKDYKLIESAGVTTAIINGVPQSVTHDVGISSFPRGGIILSVAVDSKGNAYQPLVAAGGTAVVSAAGTIASIGIGNSGSGYRAGIQTVSVSIREKSIDANNIVAIGTAQITDGHITGVAVTNGQVFYAPRHLSNFLYDNTTGISTVTTAIAHNLSIGDEITFTGIAMTCDYAPQVNVVNAVYDNTTGIVTITTDADHKLQASGQRSTVILSGIGFTCDLDLGIGTHYYPRSTDPAYCGAAVISVASTTEFTVGVGSHVTPHFYNSGGTVQAAEIFPRASDEIKANSSAFVTKINSSTDFETNVGLSTRVHFYSRCGNVQKVFDVEFDDPLSYTNIPLVYTSGNTGPGLGSEAVVDIVVGQGSSVIDFEFKQYGYGFKPSESLTIPFGGLTGIPTTSGYSEFELIVDEIFSDKFTGWSIGQLQVLDSIDQYIDGSTSSFPLSVGTNQISIVAKRGSLINVQDVLLVFVNNILQVPGKGYTFEGGSTITFTEAIKVGDDVKILFYKGSGDIDVIQQEIIETVKPGDDLQIGYDGSIGQPSYFQEEERSVMQITSVDSVDTNPYFGPGKNSDASLLRPVVWCRQTEDKIIDGIEVGKDRELYEPIIKPTASLIRTVGVGESILYVNHVRPFFDGRNENDTSLTFQNTVVLIGNEEVTGAAATAVVSAGGSITSIVISDGGSGYTSSPLVSVGGTGSNAVITSSVTAGVVTSITVSNGGSGYSQTTPPPILITPPVVKREVNEVFSYNGDSGVIVGYGASTFDPGGNKIILDLHIPFDSDLRNPVLVGSAITLTSLTAGDYFLVQNSINRLEGNEKFETFAANDFNFVNQVGVATDNIDTIYQVESTELVETSISGITTTVKRIFTRITGIGSTAYDSTLITKDSTTFTYDSVGNIYTAGISTNPEHYFGDYCFGKITLVGRSELNEFKSYSGQIDFRVGISTSDIVQRDVALKYKNFIV